MSTNVYRQFLDLLPRRPLLVGEVAAIGAGVVTVDLPGGGQVQARGTAPLGQRVFVRDGALEGEAPALTYVTADV